MLNRLIPILSVVVSSYFVYKYRYRMLNAFLGKSWIRKMAVGIAMQIPFIRDKILGSVIQFRSPQNS